MDVHELIILPVAYALLLQHFKSPFNMQFRNFVRKNRICDLRILTATSSQTKGTGIAQQIHIFIARTDSWCSQLVWRSCHCAGYNHNAKKSLSCCKRQEVCSLQCWRSARSTTFLKKDLGYIGGVSVRAWNREPTWRELICCVGKYTGHSDTWEHKASTQQLMIYFTITEDWRYRRKKPRSVTNTWWIRTVDGVIPGTVLASMIIT